MPEFLKQYLPLMALATWFIYKWVRSRRVAALLPRFRSQSAVLVDVRTEIEYVAANAPGTVNIPLQALSIRMAEIPKGVPVVVGCASGTRSGMACMQLRKNGYESVYNIGNWRNFMH